MIPNRCDTINLSIIQLQYFNENLIFFFTPHIVKLWSDLFSIIINVHISIPKTKISSVLKPVISLTYETSCFLDNWFGKDMITGSMIALLDVT